MLVEKSAVFEKLATVFYGHQYIGWNLLDKVSTPGFGLFAL